MKGENMKKKVVTLILAMTTGMVLSGCGMAAMQAEDIPAEEVSVEKESEEASAEKEAEEKESKEEESQEKETETKESEEKETQEKEPESQQVVDYETPADMSDDLFSFQVAINGELYQFPMWYADFEAMGWTYEGDASKELASNEYISYEKWSKDGITVKTTIANMSSGKKSVKESAVAGIRISYDSTMEEKNCKIELPGGIVLGESLKEDVISTYGEPDDNQDNERYHYYGYTQGWYEEINIFWDTENNIIDSISMENIVELEGTDNSVSEETPDVVASYEAPTAVGEDLYSFDVKINGNYYTFPCPVSEFLDNGYELYDHAYGDTELAAGKSGFVTMEYEGEAYKYGAVNYADYAATIDNCFIYSFDVTDREDTELEIPLGIKCGDTEEELVSKLQGYEYERNDYGTAGIGYRFYNRDDKSNSYMFDVDDGVVTTITICADKDAWNKM